MGNVFILHMKLTTESNGDKKNRVPDGLRDDLIYLGWNRAGRHGELINISDDHRALKQSLDKGYGPQKGHPIQATNLRNFLHTMVPSDLVLVPDNPRVYLAQVTSDPYFEPAVFQDGIAYRRGVERLFDTRPLSWRVLREKTGISPSPVTCRLVHNWHSELLERFVRDNLQDLIYDE